jgi:AhpD family alkylhydroperoxidase
MKNPAMIIPDVMKAIEAVTAATKQGGVPPHPLGLVHLRAGQINGCSSCVDSGSRQAKASGRPRSGCSAWRPGGRRPV